jgi:carboxylesterase type B
VRAYIVDLPVTSKELLPWCPAIDGKVIPDQPLTLMQEGRLNKNITIAFGTNQNETDSFIPDIEITSLVCT